MGRRSPGERAGRWRSGQPAGSGRQSGRRWVRKLAWLAVPLAALGELGHQLLGRLGHVLAHHFFHVVFGAGAVVVFGAYVWIDIRRNGWPSFSWRLRPPDAKEPAPRPQA